MALFQSIVFSTLFAGEWHDNTSSLVLTTKNGWQKIAFAKTVTGLAITVELFAMIAIAPMNMLQGEIYEYAFILLKSIGYAGLVMLISAAVKSNVLALIFSLAVAYVFRLRQEDGLRG